MVILGNWNRNSITISFKPSCLTFSIQGKGGSQVVSYDYTGRLWTGMLDSVSYRRGLDGKIVAKWQTSGGGRGRRWLNPGEAEQVEDEFRSLVTGLYEAIRSGEAALDLPLTQFETGAIERIIAFDRRCSNADAARYHQVYKPVGILPPDQYMAVVLQATEGCSFNTCTFCQFYRDRPFRIKRPDEFLAHAQAVKDYLAEGLDLRRTIFLGDANALITPMPLLLPLFETVHKVYDVEKLGGIYAFQDGFSGAKKSTQDYRLLVERGLKRAYIGLESGSTELLQFLKKPGVPADALQTVRSLKEAGASVGVIVLLGAGGKKYARGHVKDTIRLLNQMPFDLDDIIYFSELIEDEGLPYLQNAFQARLQPLSPEERLAQAGQIEEGLRFSLEGGTPHISRYDIREFVY